MLLKRLTWVNSTSFRCFLPIILSVGFVTFGYAGVLEFSMTSSANGTVTASVVERALRKETRRADGGKVRVETVDSPMATRFRLLTGKVTDASGTPLIGASISVKGESIGTVTDAEGNFSLEVGDRSAVVIVVTYTGYASRELLVGETVPDPYVIILDEDVATLNEVVVVGYGTQRRGSVTGAVTAVGADEIEDVPVGNVTNALAGRLPGLQVNNRSGQPGADGADLTIRGFGNPLILVDGIEQDFGNIDPEEIESITVLKDASATIYGSRAGNGVILVTTKRGQAGKPKLTFSADYSASRPTAYPEFADATLYAQLVNESDITAGRDLTFTEEEINAFRTGAAPNTDWYDATLGKTAWMQDYNLGIRGGSQALRYFFSAGVLDQSSILTTEDLNFRRYNLRSNVDANVTDDFVISLDLSGRFEQREAPNAQEFRGQAPIEGVVDALQQAKPTVPLSFPNPERTPFAGFENNLGNPLAVSNRSLSGTDDSEFHNFRAAINGRYDLSSVLTKGLYAEGRFDYLVNNNYRKRFRTAFDFYDYDPVNDTYSVASSFNGGETDLTEDQNRFERYWAFVKVGYERKFAGGHNANGFLLAESRATRNNFINTFREGFITTAVDQNFAGGDENQRTDGGAGQTGRTSYVGRLNYDYNRKYLLEFLFRVDGSTLFSQENRWGFFPGVSLGWRLSEEGFLADVDHLDNLKLRASWGQAGDEGNAGFLYITGFEFSPANYIFSDGQVNSIGIRPSRLANPDATWATTNTYNVGLDASIWNQKLDVALDVFYRKKDDVLGTRSQSVPVTFGAPLPVENINSFDNRGFELQLGHRNRVSEAFAYRISGNVSWARARWINFDEPEFETEEAEAIFGQSGEWVNRTIGFVTDGLFASQEEIDGWADITNGGNNNIIQPGDIRFVDLNDDGVINNMDQRVIGRNGNPEIFYGLNTGLSFGGFDLDLFFQGATNYSVVYGGQFTVPFGIDFTPYAFWEGRYTDENSDAGAAFPRIRDGSTLNHPNSNLVSDFYTNENAWYARLKNATLSYTIPQAGVFNNLRLYVNAFNLATLTNVEHIDPEVAASGRATARYYPQNRTYTFGIKTAF